MRRLTTEQEVSVFVDTIRKDLGRWVTISTIARPYSPTHDWEVNLVGEKPEGYAPLRLTDELLVLHPKEVLSAILQFIEKWGRSCVGI